MLRTLGMVTLLSLAAVIPVNEAAAQDPLGGAILGGATGAIIGGVAGGGRGAAIGAGIGAATGAIIAAEGQRRRGGYYYWRQGCYVEQPNGWVRVSTRYCR
jgi:outer membrane lipoprotein SlyB